MARRFPSVVIRIAGTCSNARSPPDVKHRHVVTSCRSAPSCTCSNSRRRPIRIPHAMDAMECFLSKSRSCAGTSPISERSIPRTVFCASAYERVRADVGRAVLLRARDLFAQRRARTSILKTAVMVVTAEEAVADCAFAALPI